MGLPTCSPSNTPSAGWSGAGSIALIVAGRCSSRWWSRSEPVISPGVISSRRPVPRSIVAPAAGGRGAPWDLDDALIKPAPTIAAMRVAGRIAADAMAEVGRHVAPGVATDELDRIGHEFMIAAGAYPS